MTENEIESGSKLNKQMSPVAIAALAGGAAFAWITYQYANPLRGLFVSAVVFPVIFYVVWQGQKLEKQKSDSKAAQE